MPKKSTDPKAADRRAQILDAAITEFSERGYQAASTNAIAEQAGVAKGLVFHHFGDKESLLLATFDAADAVVRAYFAGMYRDAPKDLMGRLAFTIERKVAFLHDEPRFSRLMLLGLSDAPAELKGKARARLEPFGAEMWKELLHDLDLSKLRPGVTLEDAVTAVQLLLSGIDHRNQQLIDSLSKAKRFNADDAIAFSRRMLGLMRDGVYR